MPVRTARSKPPKVTPPFTFGEIDALVMFGKENWREFNYDEAGNAIEGYYRVDVNK